MSITVTAFSHNHHVRDIFFTGSRQWMKGFAWKSLRLFWIVWSWNIYQASISTSPRSVTMYQVVFPDRHLWNCCLWLWHRAVALSFSSQSFLIVFTVPSFLSQNRKTFWWYRAHCFGQSQTALFHWQRWTDVQIYLEFSTNIKTPHSWWFQGEGFTLNYQ